MKNQELVRMIRDECEGALAEREELSSALTGWQAVGMLIAWRQRFERLKAVIDNPHCERCESSQPTGVVCDECRVKEPTCPV